jgi:hypothetical protein
MNTPSSAESIDIVNFDNLSPVVNLDVFAAEFVDSAPPTLPLPSQLANVEDSTIIPAAGSLGSPATGSLTRQGSESSDRLTESQLRQLLEYRNYHFTDRVSEEERQQRLSDSSLRQDMERQADDSRSMRGTSINIQRELSDDQLRQELERRKHTLPQGTTATHPSRHRRPHPTGYGRKRPPLHDGRVHRQPDVVPRSDYGRDPSGARHDSSTAGHGRCTSQVVPIARDRGTPPRATTGTTAETSALPEPSTNSECDPAYRHERHRGVHPPR